MTAKRPIRISRRRGQRGSALVESAFCFLGFIFLTLGLVEFSMAVYAFNFCTYSASEGARYASLRGFHSGAPVSSWQIQTFVRNQAVALVRSRVIVESTWIPNNHPGSVVQVKVKYRFNPIVKVLMREDMDLSSTSRMVIAN